MATAEGDQLKILGFARRLKGIWYRFPNVARPWHQSYRSVRPEHHFLAAPGLPIE